MAIFKTKKGFLKAAREGDLDALCKYLNSGSPEKWRNVCDSSGNNAVFVAVHYRHAAAAEYLIENGFPKHATNNDGETLLIHAAWSSTEECARLAAQFCEVNALDKSQATALYHAAAHDREALVDFLLDKGADVNLGSSALAAAAYAGHYNLVQKLLARGADINGVATRHDRRTPLLSAVYRDRDEIVRDLLARGADVHARDASGYTALHLCVYASDKEIGLEMAQLLLQHGADPSARNKCNQTAADMCKSSSEKSELYKTLKGRKRETGKTVLLPRPAAQDAKQPQDEWRLLGTHSVAHIGTYPQIARRLTSVFNFETRERHAISENLASGAEIVQRPENFDDLSETLLRRALDAFRDAGGTADESAVFGLSRHAKSPLFRPAAE
jgi:ankyrin repeat protein